MQDVLEVVVALAKPLGVRAEHRVEPDDSGPVRGIRSLSRAVRRAAAGHARAIVAMPAAGANLVNGSHAGFGQLKSHEKV